MAVQHYGNLGEIPTLEVLRRLRRERMSGTLELHADGETRRVHLVAGEVRGAATDRAGHRLGDRLLARGLVSGEDLGRALEDRSRPLGEALIAIGALDRPSLAWELERLVGDLVESAVPWHEGYFRFVFTPTPVEADRMLEISTVNLLLDAVRRHPSIDSIRAALGDLAAPLVWREGGFETLGSLQLAPAEGYLVSRLDGRTSTADLVKIAPVPEEAVLRLVYALVVVGVVEKPKPPARKTIAVAAAVRVEPASRPRVPSPTPTAALERDELDYLRRKIVELSSGLAAIGPYQLFELPRNATYRELRTRHEVLCQRYDPALADHPELADLASRLVAIRRRLDEDFRKLAEKLRRSSSVMDVRS